MKEIAALNVLSDERAAAQALLAERTPEDIAVALIRLYRARLPAPEDLYDGAVADGPRTIKETQTGSDAVWFRMIVGRNANADPRWLIPLICRCGLVTKKEIGTIRILDPETKFEIAPYAAGRFAAAVRRPGDDDQDIRIEAMRSERPSSPKAQRRPAAAKRKQPRRERRR